MVVAIILHSNVFRRELLQAQCSTRGEVVVDRSECLKSECVERETDCFLGYGDPKFDKLVDVS